MINILLEFIYKFVDLPKRLIINYSHPLLKIDKLEFSPRQDDCIIYFSRVGSQKSYSATVKTIFANSRLISKFSNKDALKIGYYCAKCMLIDSDGSGKS